MRDDEAPSVYWAEPGIAILSVLCLVVAGAWAGLRATDVRADTRGGLYAAICFLSPAPAIWMRRGFTFSLSGTVRRSMPCR